MEKTYLKDLIAAVRIIHCGNLLVLHPSHLLNMPNNENLVRSSKYYDTTPAIAKISVTFS